MKIENTNCMLVEKEGKILLVKRGNRTFHGWWCMPGGHFEAGENPLQAAQREANEEVGKVKVEKKPFMVFVHDWPADSHTPEPHQHRCHAFRAKITGDLRAGDDASELRWVTLEEARKLKITEYTRRVLEKLPEPEHFVVVDKNDNVTGKASREECHSNRSLMHRAVAVLVMNKKGEILLERRSAKKDLYPGFWGLVAGHAGAGEGYGQAAKREMMEETGAACRLRPLFKTILRMKEETEMEAVFTCTYEGPFRVNKEESDEVRFFPKEEIMKMLEAGKIPEGDSKVLRRFFKISKP